MLRGISRRARPEVLPFLSAKASRLPADEATSNHFETSLRQFDGLDPLPFLGVEADAAGNDPPPELAAGAGFAAGKSARNSVIVRHAPTNANTPAHWNARIECRLVDLNMSGVALRTANEIGPGTHVDMRIRSAKRSHEVEVGGTVVRCEPAKLGGFHIICRLNRYLAFSEIQEIGYDLFASSIV